MPEILKQLIFKTPLISAFFVFVFSSLVILGWIYDIDILKSWLSGESSMKFSSAICFLCASISLFSLYFYDKGFKDLTIVIVPTTSLLILFIMGILLLGNFVELSTGIESLFIKESETAVKTVSPGMPTTPTMIGFVLFAVTSIIVLLQDKYVKYENLVLSAPLFVMGLLSSIGYLIEIPFLYFKYSADVNPVSFNTAICFVILAVGQILLIKDM